MTIAPPNIEQVIKEMTNELRYFTVPELAELLNVSHRSIYRAIKNNSLPAARITKSPHGQFRIAASDVQAFARAENGLVQDDLQARRVAIAKLEQRHGVPNA